MREFVALPSPRSGNFINLTGQRYGRLTVTGYAGGDGKHSYWWCRCDCGTEAKVSANKLRKAHTKSCGCLSADVCRSSFTTHGMSRDPLYNVWAKMRNRCSSTKDPAFPDYGGRGIRVCQRWINGDGSREGFACFLDDMGPKPSPSHSLDRIDNNGDYTPENCRWATKTEQARNRRSNYRVTMGGRSCALSEACEQLGLPFALVNSRIQQGWSTERALSQPFRKSRHAHS